MAEARILKIDLSVQSHQAGLLELLDHYARDVMGGSSPISAYARAHLIDALKVRTDYVGFLAWLDDACVGLINCFEGFSTFSAKPLLNIHDLAVDASVRGRGIGQKLLHAAEQEAHGRGCCKLTLEVLSKNEVALASYERFGFRAYQLDPNAGQALFLEKKLT